MSDLFDALVPVEGGYAVQLDAQWSIGAALNGGYLMSLLAAAAVDALPHPHAVATSAHFLAPPAPGQAFVRVEVLRTGRSVSAASVRLEQDGRPCLAALVTAAQLPSTGGLDADAEPGKAGGTTDDGGANGDGADAGPAYGVPGRAHVATRPSPLPAYEECVKAHGPLPDGTPVALLDQVDLRLDPATAGWALGRPSGALEMRAWFGLPGSPSLDPRAVALAVDALPPTPFNIGVVGWCPTVELTCFLRALPAPGPVAVHLTGRMARHGWVDEEAEVYDATGALVAQSRQLARLPR